MQAVMLRFSLSIHFREVKMLSLRIIIALCFLIALQPAPAQGQQMDREVMMRWSRAQIVHYHIVGVYQAQTDVIGDANWIGYADVKDRVIIDLNWKLSASMFVGTPIIVNEKSTISNLRNYQPGCAPPVLKGEYEHYDLLGMKAGMAGALELQVRTTYPAAEVVQSCTGTHKAVPGNIDVRPEDFVVPSPVMLAMPLPDSDDLSISKDKKSFIVKKNGWTWTFTPSIDTPK
jgi:hypothetical protein